MEAQHPYTEEQVRLLQVERMAIDEEVKVNEELVVYHDVDASDEGEDVLTLVVTTGSLRVTLNVAWKDAELLAETIRSKAARRRGLIEAFGFS